MRLTRKRTADKHREPALIISGKSNARTCEAFGGGRRRSPLGGGAPGEGDLGQGPAAEKEVKFEKAERNSITMLKYCQIMALR